MVGLTLAVRELLLKLDAHQAAESGSTKLMAALFFFTRRLGGGFTSGIDLRSVDREGSLLWRPVETNARNAKHRSRENFCSVLSELPDPDIKFERKVPQSLVDVVLLQ
jgi:hypothetical protein